MMNGETPIGLFKLFLTKKEMGNSGLCPPNTEENGGKSKKGKNESDRLLADMRYFSVLRDHCSKKDEGIAKKNDNDEKQAHLR